MLWKKSSRFKKLLEAEQKKKPTQVKDKKSTAIDFDDPISKGQLTTPKKSGKLTTSQMGTSGIRPSYTSPGRGASEVMSRAIDKIKNDPNYQDDVAEIEFIDDEFATRHGMPVIPKPPKISTKNALTKSKRDLKTQSTHVDFPRLTINWLPLPSTPMYHMFARPFDPLFRHFLGVGSRDVVLATSLDVRGTRTKDLMTLVSYLAAHGERVDEFNQDAFDIPEELLDYKGYVYEYEGHKYLVLTETLTGQHNFYIYTDNKDLLDLGK